MLYKLYVNLYLDLKRIWKNYNIVYKIDPPFVYIKN